MLPSEYGARVGLVSVEPPSLSQGGGVMTELVVAGGVREHCSLYGEFYDLKYGLFSFFLDKN